MKKRTYIFIYSQFLYFCLSIVSATLIMFASIGMYSILPSTHNVILVGYCAAISFLLTLNILSLVYELYEVNKKNDEYR